MSGIERIAAERQRQIDVEGYTSEHDDRHVRTELLSAAVAYASLTRDQQLLPKASKLVPGMVSHYEWMYWPNNWGEFKPSEDLIRNLEKAGALIAAEIDRLERRS